MGVTGCSALQLFISAQTHQILVYDETDWDVMAELREVSDKLWELPQMEVLHLSFTNSTKTSVVKMLFKRNVNLNMRKLYINYLIRVEVLTTT